MEKIIKIVIADDHPMFREGIRLMLEKEKNIMVVAEAGDGDELLRVMDDVQPDLVITDIEMPVMNGIEATRKIRQQFPKTRIIALTMFGDEHLIIEMLEAGANGYLLKNTKKAELLEAITTTVEGGAYFCDSTSLKLSKMIAKSKIGEQEETALFSEKEAAIIQLICEQYASKQIASMTKLSHRTVEKYRDHIMQKAGARNVVGIVIYAIRHGMFTP